MGYGIKELTRYILIFLLFSFMGCQQDDIYMNEQSAEGSATITKISFSQIKSDPKHRRVAGTVDEFTKSIKLKHNATGRLVYNEEYGFYIDEENGIYIEDGEKHSYTFRIERPETGEKIENIVFTPDGNGGYKTMLAKYDINKDEFYTLTEAELKERGVTMSEYGKPPGTLNLVCKLVWRFEMGPPREANNDGGDVQYVGNWVVDVIDCHWTGGGASGPGGGGDSGGGNNGPSPSGPTPGSGGGGNTGSNPPPPVITTPVVRTPQNEDPCNNLKALLQPTGLNLNSYINMLAQFYQQGMKIEASYSFKTVPNDTDTPQYAFYYNNGADTSVGTKAGNYYFADLHFHPKNSFPEGGLFSWQDIKGLQELYTRATPAHKEANDIASFLLAPDPQNINNYRVYAITVNNIAKLTAAVDTEWNSSKWSHLTDADKRKKRIQSYYGELFSDNAGNLEKYFLELFADYGISLYELENNEWKRVMLNSSAPNGVFKKPC